MTNLLKKFEEAVEKFFMHKTTGQVQCKEDWDKEIPADDHYDQIYADTLIEVKFSIYEKEWSKRDGKIVENGKILENLS